MGINKIEIDRHEGQALFVGPGGLVMCVKRGITSLGRNPVIRCGLDRESKIFTPKGIIGAFPADISDDGRRVFDDVYSRLDNFPVDDARKMLVVFGAVCERARPMPAPSYLEFNRLYFLLTRGVKAMINIVYGGTPISARFNIFSEEGCIVDTRENLKAVFEGIASGRGNVSEGASECAGSILSETGKFGSFHHSLDVLNRELVRALFDEHRAKV
jgi:hypothetical protein